MRFDVHVWFHQAEDTSTSEALLQLKRQGEQIMATTRELVDLANAAAAEIAKFGPAVDALEQAVSDALAKIPSIPPEAQADIDNAVALLQGVVSGSQAALADAADGVNEAGLAPVPPVEPTP